MVRSLEAYWLLGSIFKTFTFSVDMTAAQFFWLAMDELPDFPEEFETKDNMSFGVMTYGRLCKELRSFETAGLRRPYVDFDIVEEQHEAIWEAVRASILVTSACGEVRINTDDRCPGV